LKVVPQRPAFTPKRRSTGVGEKQNREGVRRDVFETQGAPNDQSTAAEIQKNREIKLGEWRPQMAEHLNENRRD